MKSSFVLLAVMALVMATLAPAAAQGRGVTVETQDVLDQGGPAPDDREVYAHSAATLRRTPNGITAQIQMPTPEPGTYDYPDPDDHPTASEPGHPEAFTLWVFVFDPEQPAFNPEAGQHWSGAFLGGGHLVGGPNLTLTGHISKNSEPVAGLPLENPDVEVHLAIAPHGGLDPDIMPEQIKTPAGGPPMWWIAVFD